MYQRGLLEVDVGEEEQQKEGGEKQPALDHLRRRHSESVDLILLQKINTYKHWCLFKTACTTRLAGATTEQCS